MYIEPMASWIGAWLSYYQNLYMRGLLAFVFASLTFLLSVLVFYIPAAAITGLVGIDASDTGLVVIAGVVGSPAIFASLLRNMPKEALPDRPPSWSSWRIGVRGGLEKPE